MAAPHRPTTVDRHATSVPIPADPLLDVLATVPHEDLPAALVRLTADEVHEVHLALTRRDLLATMRAPTARRDPTRALYRLDRGQHRRDPRRGRGSHARRGC